MYQCLTKVNLTKASGQMKSILSSLTDWYFTERTGIRFKSTLEQGPVLRLARTLRSFSAKCKSKDFYWGSVEAQK